MHCGMQWCPSGRIAQIKQCSYDQVRSGSVCWPRCKSYLTRSPVTAFREDSRSAPPYGSDKERRERSITVQRCYMQRRGSSL